jgi:hypothetical protein
MAVSSITITTLASSLFQDTANTNGAIVIKGSSGTLYMLEVDNTALAAVVYVKLYNTSGSVTVGTTDPDWVFRITASINQSHIWIPGIAFSSGLQVATVTAGGTGGTTAPATPPTVRIAYT